MRMPETATRRAQKRASYLRTYSPAKRAQKRAETRQSRPFIALDGEGYTTSSGEHRYTYLAAASEHGEVWEASNPLGLTFEEVARFLLDLPSKATLVGFSLGYDRTKWIESLSDRQIYRLLHPEARIGSEGRPIPIRAASYRVNLVSSRFTLTHYLDPLSKPESRTVWDLFKFFQCSFVKALRKWQIAPEKEIAQIERMKERRGSFRGIGKRERDYCQHECRLLAKLARALYDAHETAGLVLPHFYGPGSTASVLLKKLEADAHNATSATTGKLGLFVSSAYFGGRFEGSHTGPLKPRRGKRIKSWDIASAYPYAFAQLPCFACGGRWRKIKKVRGKIPAPKDGKLRAAVYQWSLEAHNDNCRAWGPLPIRSEDGEITFPILNAGGAGFAWSAEIYEAKKLSPGVTLHAGYEWVPRCECEPPFRAEIAKLFTERLRWGKNSLGIVIKLALNSLYGKSAQRAGSAVYKCLVRAGLITSYTRAMLLRALRRARDPWDVLELATDSIMSREELGELGAPETLGTEAAAREHDAAPLGAWEPKEWPKGPVFLVRPGLRFSMARTADAGTTAARGVGTRTLHENRARVVRKWRRSPLETVTVQQPAMFVGARVGVRQLGDGSYVRDAKYGTWVKPTPRKVSYSPCPKRESVAAHRGALRLVPHEYEGIVSAPYDIANRSARLLELKRAREWEDEQDSLERAIG